MSSDSYWQPGAWRRRRVLRAGAFGGVGLASVLAVGCGDDDDGKKTTPTATTASGTASAAASASASASGTAAAQPKRGGILPLIWTPGEGPQNLDPHVTSHAAVVAGSGGLGSAYSRLVRLKTVPESPPPMLTEVIGDTAEKWEQPDDTTFVFTLRKGIKYQNIAPVNGREWTADDLLFSWNRQVEKKVRAAELAGFKWSAPDKYTVKIDLTAPDPDILLRLYSLKVDIAKEVVTLKNDDLKDGPIVGTGPFIYKDWKYNEVARMTRNPDYFITGIPYVDELAIFRIADLATGLAALRTKQVLARGSSPSEIKQLKSESKDIQSGGVATAGTWLMLNQDKPPMNDLRVRQAVSKAIDRQAVYDSLEGIWGWGGALSFLPKEAVVPEAEYKKLLANDMKEAKALLQAAGVTNWKPEMLVFVSTGTVDAAEVMGQNFKAVGIEAKITPIDGNRYIGLLNAGAAADYDLFVMTRTVSSPNFELKDAVKGGGAHNILKLKNAELDALIDKQSTMVKDTAGRAKILQDAQRKMMELAAPIVLSLRQETYAWWGNELKNYIHTSASLSEYLGYAYAWRA